MRNILAICFLAAIFFVNETDAYAADAQSDCDSARADSEVTRLGASIAISKWTICGQDSASGAASTDTTTAFVARIDLGSPLLTFTVAPAPASGASKPDWQQETTSQFLLRTGSHLAVNANLFADCCGYTGART